MTSTRSSEAKLSVTLEVEEAHPLLVVKKTLDWETIETGLAKHWRAAGKNVDGGPGRKFDLKYWARVMVLMLLMKLEYREMERELKYNALSRLFVQVEEPTEGYVRDHANIDRTYRALGVEGLEELNRLVVKKAMEWEYTEGKTLSSDTTIQEARIPYPNEPGILSQVGMKLQRLCARIVKKGGEKFKEVAEGVVQRARTLLHKVKEYRLFAKSEAEKDALLNQMLETSEEMMQKVVVVQVEVGKEKQNHVLKKAGEKLRKLQSFMSVLREQITSWMETGQVAVEKRLHPEIVEARAHTKNKPGKKVEFGFKWLINRLKGGYLFGQMFFGRPGESKMPENSIRSYQDLLETKQVPEIYIYDRGAWSQETIEGLQEMGVKKIGIQPKGQAAWLVEEADRDTVKSMRGQTEGSIGILKTGGYRFKKPRAYSTRTTQMAGHRAIASLNLNLLMNDLQNGQKAS